MPVLLIHLTDMHFTVKARSFISRAVKIIDAAFSPIAHVEDVHIIFSGDLTNWGLDEEYAVALEFIDNLRAAIKDRNNIDAKFLVCAGNHDCNFSGDQAMRDVVIANLRRDAATLEITPGLAKGLAVPLEKFMTLQSTIAPGVNQVNVWRSTIQFDGAEPLRYVLLNSSVTCTKDDPTPGLLIMPIPPMEEHDGNRRTIYVMHHPLNWFQPSNARELAQHASAAADLFLMGHEHELSSQTSHELYEDSSVTYLKGHVLRDTDSDANSAFQTILIDSNNGFLLRSYRWEDDRYDAWEQKSLKEYQAWPTQNGTRKLTFNSETYKQLTSAGASFTHRRKDVITLPDIFVWPSIRPDDAKTSSHGILSNDELSSEEEFVNNFCNLPHVVVIRGGEQNGKTALAKMLALSLSRKGNQPLLLAASAVSSWREKSLNGRIDDLIDSMYGKSNREEYKQLAPNRKTLIVDDFDLGQVRLGLIDGLHALQQSFGTVFLMLDFHPGLEVALREFMRQECFNDSKIYDILNTNYNNRLELIEKWISIGYTFINDDERRTMAAQLGKVVDETLGRNLIPSVPVFVLIILQQAELSQDLDTVVKSGSQGFLYESMIQQAIRTKVKVFNLVTCLAYLTALATHFKNNNLSSLSQLAFEEFHVKHCKKFALKTSVRKLQSQLVAADILDDRDDVVSFKYPFHNYYFTARSLAQIDTWLLQEPEIDKLIEAIHTERNANILLFLAHLERNPRIAEKILQKAAEMFKNYKKADFFIHLRAIDEYSSGRVREIVFHEGPRHLQVLERQQDLLQAEFSERELAEIAESRLRQRLEDALAMNAGFKTLQVLGQILRNHAGEIEGPEKGGITRACADLGLRILGFLYELIAEHGEEMIEFRAAQLKSENPSLTDVEVAEELESYLARFLTSISIGAVIKIANAIGAEDLEVTLEEVLVNNATDRFIKLATQLEHFSDFPSKEIIDYGKEFLERGAYLPNALMRRFLIRRFQLFPVRDELKREVLGKFKIKALPFKFLEQKKLD